MAGILQEPLMEKLAAMRLLGNGGSVEGPGAGPAARELSFFDRLGLLVDQQWTWREKRALARRLHVAKLQRWAPAWKRSTSAPAHGLEKSVIRGLAQKTFSCWVRPVWARVWWPAPLAQKGCRDGYSALYTRAAALFRSVLVRLSRIDVVVIDD